MFCSIGGKQALWHPSMSRCHVYDKGTGDPQAVMCFAEINIYMNNNVQPVNHQHQQPFTQYVVRVDSMEFLELLQRELWRWAEGGREEVPARGVHLPRIGQTGGGL